MAVGSLITAIKNGYEGSRASMSIMGIDPVDSSKIYKKKNYGVDLSERAFQYWPESINDSIEIGWSFKDLPGGSHGLASWKSNGGRTISFDLPLTRITKPMESDADSLLDKMARARGTTVSPDNYMLVSHNIDIAEYIRYLRAFAYPTYVRDNKYTVTMPPPISVLYMPNMGLNEDGSDIIYAVMTGCDVVYTLLFPNGTPRKANVSLSFKQVVQKSDGIRFVGFGNLKGSVKQYKMGDRAQGFDANAGRSLNSMKGKI